MKTRKLIRIAGLLTALCMGIASGQQKISERASLGSGGLDPAVDFLPIVETSAGLSGDKKITPNALLTGWGFSTPGKNLAKAATVADQRTFLGMVGNIYNLSWGTAVGNLVRLDAATGKLPAVDGSRLTNLPGGYTIASQAEAEAGTENTKLVTPLRVAQAITALAPGGGGGGGGLTNFLESLNSAAPNTSIPVASLTATNAAANVDIALSPKGAGAILGHTPTGSAAGGNKRGARAVDFQTSRSISTAVASGGASVIAGGLDNQASGFGSVVAGGEENTASDSYAFAQGFRNNASGESAVVLGGQDNSASAFSSVVIGGSNNLAEEENAVVLGGADNVASGPFSTASGYGATTRGIYGATARASGQFSIAGDAQKGTYILRRFTTNAAETELSADGGTPAVATRVGLDTNSVYSFRGLAAARSSAAGDCKAWRFEGTIEKGANNAATAIIGSVTSTSDGDAGASAWTLTIDADTTNGTLRFQATGAAATTIRWLVTVETAELKY
jgi:hypothetical protein